MILKNLKTYKPKIKEYGEDAVYLIDENGRDWYESQQDFSADKLKITFDETGLIISQSFDVSALFPLNASVAEIETELSDVTGLYFIGDKLVTAKKPSQYHNWNGTEWEISEENLAEIKAIKLQQFITAIDDKAASIYSVWTRFEQEYTSRENAAKAFKGSNYEDEVSRFIADFATKAGIDNKTAADLILVQAEGLRKLLVELANQRMRKYELKKDGLTEDEMQAIYDDIIQQMEKLAEAYQNG